MKHMNSIDIQTLREILRYDSHGGLLFWRERREHRFTTRHACRAWNARYANKPAFTAKNGKKYLIGSINGRLYLAHRVIWALIFGYWPDNHIDHINGDRSDNRISNLRVVTPIENSWNRRVSAKNKSGVNGVYWSHHSQKWCASIKVRGNKTHIGCFDDLAEAANARALANIQFGFHPNHGKPS